MSKRSKHKDSNRGWIFLVALVLIAIAALLGWRYYPASNLPSQKTGTLAESKPPPSLTDVAPAPRIVEITEQPTRSKPEPEDYDPESEIPGVERMEKTVILPDPKIMDIRNPPQWTQPIAVPQRNPTPPDPFSPPPIKVDPRRNPPADTTQAATAEKSESGKNQ